MFGVVGEYSQGSAAAPFAPFIRVDKVSPSLLSGNLEPEIVSATTPVHAASPTSIADNTRLTQELAAKVEELAGANQRLAAKDNELAEKIALLLAIKNKLLELSEIRAEANNQPAAFKINALQVVISILTLGAAYFYFKAKHYEEQTKQSQQQLGLFNESNSSLKRVLLELGDSIPETPNANP